MTSTQYSESTPEQRMLHASAPPDFLESAHEWRRLFSEAWGTFLLVVVAAGAGVVGALSGGVITLSMKVAAPGMMVMAIIYFMGAVGGAHLNPAVTLAFAVRRNFPWDRVPGYIIAQFIGGIAAAVSSMGNVRHRWTTWRDHTWPGDQRFQGTRHGSAVNGRLGQHHSRYCVRRAKYWFQRCTRSGRLYCPCGTLGSTYQRCVNESRPVTRPRSGSRRYEHNLDLRRRPDNRRHDRCRV